MESMGGRLGRQEKAKWDISETGNQAEDIRYLAQFTVTEW